MNYEQTWRLFDRAIAAGWPGKRPSVLGNFMSDELADRAKAYLEERGETVEEAVPTAVATSTFRVFGIDVVCHVLDNGMRIIEAESMERLFKVMHSDQNVGDLAELLAWSKGIN